MGEGIVSEYLDSGFLEESGYRVKEQARNAVNIHNGDTGVAVSYADDTLYVRPWSDDLPSFNVDITEDGYEIDQGSLDGSYGQAETFVERVFAVEHRRGIDDPVAAAQHRMQTVYDQVRNEDPATIADELGTAAINARQLLDDADLAVKRAKQSDPSVLQLHYGKQGTDGKGVDDFILEFDDDPQRATQTGYCTAAILMHETDQKPQINNGYKHKDHHQGAAGTPITDAFDARYDNIRFHNSG